MDSVSALCQETKPFQLKLPEKGHKECRDTMHTYTLKVGTAKMNWSHECLMKVFYGELRERKRSQSGQKKRYKDAHPKCLAEGFPHFIESWEQAAHDRAIWGFLIRKRGAQYEAKRILEAERKRKKRQGMIIRVVTVTFGVHLLFLQPTV